MTRFIIERDVLIPMRDGTRLCADIYRPETPQPVPAILSRTPYNKDNKFSPNMHEFAIDAVRAVEVGFAVVFQDVRGRYKSEGDFYPFRHEMDGGTLENYQGLRARAGSSAARDGQYLIVGPWAHGEKSGTYAEYAHGSAANIEAVDTTAWQIDFFRCMLGLDQQALAQRARVRLFVMGINQWRDEDDYPLARAHEQRYFLTNDGLRLTGEAGSVMEFVSDPADPMPTMGGPTFLPGLNISLNAGPRDNRAVLERSDVLRVFSDVLDEPLEVTGPIRAELRVSCDAPRYDVVVRLCDVHPDGRLRLLCEGIIRINAPAVGEDQEVVVDVGHTSNVFLAGHRVGVLVTGASFPRFDVTLSQPARCRLLSSSALLLPCVSPRG